MSQEYVWIGTHLKTCLNKDASGFRDIKILNQTRVSRMACQGCGAVFIHRKVTYDWFITNKGEENETQTWQITDQGNEAID